MKVTRVILKKTKWEPKSQINSILKNKTSKKILKKKLSKLESINQTFNASHARH
jgi:hypothetical protein